MIVFFQGGFDLGKFQELRIGGMESHAEAFKLFFSDEIYATVLKTSDNTFFLNDNLSEYLSLQEVLKDLDRELINIVFINDGYWIEELDEIASYFKTSKLIFRSGGNEFLKAPWKDNQLPLSVRQHVWVKRINENVDCLIANSLFTKNRMINIGFDERIIRVVYGGVNLDWADSNVAHRTYLRDVFDKEYKTKGCVLFGIVSRFEEFKGILNVLEAFASIPTSKCWHLLLVGDGRQKRDIKLFCENNLNADSYTMIEKVNNKESMKYISILDYLLNLSVLYNKQSGDGFYVHTETMGRSMIEAVCQGVPVIASDVGGTKELFFNNDNIGFLLNNCNALESVVSKCIANKYSFNLDKDSRAKLGWDYLFGVIYREIFNG